MIPAWRLSCRSRPSPNCVVELTASRRRKRDKTSMQLNVDLIRLIAREVKRVGMGRMPLGGIKVRGRRRVGAGSRNCTCLTSR